MVVTVFLNTGSIAYLKPVSESPSVCDLMVSVFYTVVPPTLNPIIYSLKNKDMKAAFSKMLKRLSSYIMTRKTTTKTHTVPSDKHEATSVNSNRLPAI